MKNNFVDNELSEQARLTTKKFRKKLASEMSYKSTYNGDALSFDWVDIIEEACPRIDIIVRNAKVALVQEANVELIEKAKRITVRSNFLSAKESFVFFICKLPPAVSTHNQSYVKRTELINTTISKVTYLTRYILSANCFGSFINNSSC